MKNLFIACFSILTFSLTAQTTFDINWTVGAGPADVTLQQGDTVRWTWGDGLQHSVTSLPGGAESFDSGLMTGMGTEYSFTFTVVGSTDYQCDVHPATMFGTVTTEMILSAEDQFVRNLQLYPNPATDVLNVFSLYQLDEFSIYSITGSLVQNGDISGNFNELNIASLNPGVYFVNLRSGDLSHTARIVVETK